jgi:hypothetical protein
MCLNACLLGRQDRQVVGLSNGVKNGRHLNIILFLRFFEKIFAVIGPFFI